MRTRHLQIVKIAAVVMLVWFAASWLFVKAHDALPGLHYTITAPGCLTRSAVRVRETDFGIMNGYAWRIRALSITDKSAVLLVQTGVFPDGTSFETMHRGLDGVAPQKLTYKPCTQLALPVNGAASLVLTGFTLSPCAR